jgi:hypothetical protein
MRRKADAARRMRRMHGRKLIHLLYKKPALPDMIIMEKSSLIIIIILNLLVIGCHTVLGATPCVNAKERLTERVTECVNNKQCVFFCVVNIFLVSSAHPGPQTSIVCIPISWMSRSKQRNADSDGKI